MTAFSSEGADLIVQVPLSFRVKSFWFDDLWHRFLVWQALSQERLLGECAVYEFLHSHCGGSFHKVEVMESLDGRHFAEVDAQKGCPVKCWHNHFAIFSATQLGNVDSRGLSDHSRNVIQAVNLGLPVQTLDETKTPVTAEFGVAIQQERQCDLLVPPSQDSPHQILHHASIFVLPAAVVGVEMHIMFSQAILLKEEMQQRHHTVGTLPSVDTLIKHEVNLFGECLTGNAEETTLARALEIDGSRL